MARCTQGLQLTPPTNKTQPKNSFSRRLETNKTQRGGEQTTKYQFNRTKRPTQIQEFRLRTSASGSTFSSDLGTPQPVLAPRRFYWVPIRVSRKAKWTATRLGCRPTKAPFILGAQSLGGSTVAAMIRVRESTRFIFTYDYVFSSHICRDRHEQSPKTSSNVNLYYIITNISLWPKW